VDGDRERLLVDGAFDPEVPRNLHHVARGAVRKRTKQVYVARTR